MLTYNCPEIIVIALKKSPRRGFFNLLLIVSLTINSTNLSADPVHFPGVPYIQNYSKSIYQFGNQNWSIAQTPDHLLYFGNTKGLLSYDGREWDHYKFGNDLIVRSLATDETGRVYCGGLGEFGYYEYDKKGDFAYHNLSDLLKGSSKITDEVWKIYVTKDRVLFQAFSAVYIYEHGKIKVVHANNAILFLLQAGKRFFAQVFFSKGLFELKGDKFEYVPGSDVLNNNNNGDGVLSVLPYKINQYLIGTSKRGLFLFDGKKISAWSNSASEFLERNHINCGIAFGNKYFAYGTITGGIVIIDYTGQLVQLVDKSQGLQNNTILSLYFDKQQNLWAGLDNGISRIDIDSSLSYYFDTQDKLGTIYTSYFYNNNLYLGTNHGLFYSSWPKPEKPFFDFNLISNSQSQVWDLSLIDNQLICGENEATYTVSGNLFRKISPIQGGWTIRKLKTNPDILIQGYYNGLALYKRDKDGWVFYTKIDKFLEPSLYVEEDASGDIWVTSTAKSIYKLKLSADLKSVVSFKKYDNANGLPPSSFYNVFMIKSQMVVATEAGIYYYNSLTDSFVKYTELNASLRSFSSSHKIIPGLDQKYWFIKDGKIAIVNFSEDDKIKTDSTSLNLLSGRMIQSYENISNISSSISLISIDGGFVLFNKDRLFSTAENYLPKVLIRKFSTITDKTITLTENIMYSNMLSIPYKRNSIQINYALPAFSSLNPQYQYYLEGYSSQWSEWSESGFKEFTNLPYGNYTFKIRAKLNDKISDPNLITFIVLRPWYLNGWSIFGYVVLSVVLFFLLKTVYLNKLKKNGEKIAAKLKVEKDQQLKEQQLLNEKRIIELNNERLNLELHSRSRELSNATMNLVSKNELLQKLKEDLIDLKGMSTEDAFSNKYRKIQNIIEDGLSDHKDWAIFEQSFNQAHSDFFNKLKEKYPSLHPSDLKLCAYLYMNMNSKEIATLLNITLKGVEIRRYRLRKKFELKDGANLTEFLYSI